MGIRGISWYLHLLVIAAVMLQESLQTARLISIYSLFTCVELARVQLSLAPGHELDLGFL